MNLVLAGNPQEALRYAREKNWGPHEWKPLNSIGAVKGLKVKSIELHKVGGWYTRSDADEILDMVKRIRVTLPSAPVESPPTVNLTNRLPHPPLPSRPPVWPAVVMALIVAAGLLLALVLLSGCHSPQLPPVGPIPDLPAFDSLREASKPATLVEP